MKSLLERIRKWLGRLRGRLRAASAPAEPAGQDTSVTSPTRPSGPDAEAWRRCRLASCWNGPNAAERHMNLLSPHFSDGKVDAYMEWQRGRGTDTLHLILCNRGDGEGCRYGLYGRDGISWKIDAAWRSLALQRIRRFADEGYSIVLWGMTDDAGDWNRRLLENPERYMSDLHQSGLLECASMFVLGLEMTEWGASARQLAAYRDAVRRYYKGAIGTHHNSGRMDYRELGNVLLYQTGRGKSAGEISGITRDVIRRAGMPVWMFELERWPARELCEAALAAGAAGVGNW